MREAIVILPPDVTGQKIIERSNRSPPGEAARDLQPFGVLIEHRIDDVDEGLVAVEQAMPAGQQISFQPALALMFAEHFHHPPVASEVFIRLDRSGSSHCRLVASKHVGQTIGHRFIGAEDAKIAMVLVLLHAHRAETAQHARVFGLHCAGLGNLHARSRGNPAGEDRAARRPPLACGIGSHARFAARRQFAQLGFERAVHRQTVPAADSS